MTDSAGDSDSDTDDTGVGSSPVIELEGHWALPDRYAPVGQGDYALLVGGECRLAGNPWWTQLRWEDTGEQPTCSETPLALNCETHLEFTSTNVFWHVRFKSHDCDGDGYLRGAVDLETTWAFVENEGDLDWYDVGGFRWKALKMNDTVISVDVDLGGDVPNWFSLISVDPFPAMK